MVSERTMDASNESLADSLSVCSTISSDTYREEKKATKLAALGEANQAKLDAVWSARTDVDTAKETLAAALDALTKAEQEYRKTREGIPKLKARFMPPREVQTAKANYQEAKTSANLARMRLKHCQSVLDRKKEEGSKLGVDVRPVPELIRVSCTSSTFTSTFTAIEA